MASIFKTLNTGDIASGNYAEKPWVAPRDLTIKKMLIVERNGYSLDNVQVFISIDDVPYTKDFVPASVIGSDTEYCWKPNLPIKQGTRIYVKVQNSSGNTINCDIVFEYE